MSGLPALIVWSHRMVVSHNILHLSSSSTPSGWCSHHFSLLFKPFLQRSFQWASLALFLRQTVILAKYMIYCFTHLATQPTKRRVHGLVYVNDIWNKSYMNCGNEMKMDKWSSHWTQFMQLRQEVWLAWGRTSTGFEPVTSRYLCWTLHSLFSVPVLGRQKSVLQLSTFTSLIIIIITIIFIMIKLSYYYYYYYYQVSRKVCKLHCNQGQK